MQMNTVAYDEGHKMELETKLLLADAISDLPPVRKICPLDCYIDLIRFSKFNCLFQI